MRECGSTEDQKVLLNYCDLNSANNTMSLDKIHILLSLF